MGKILTVIVLLFTFYGNANAQKFPFDLEPLSHPMTIQMRYPIKLVSSRGLVNRNESTYRYEGAVTLNGIDFSLLFLMFTSDKLTSLQFGVRNNDDYLKIAKALSAKYKKSTGCGSVEYCFRNGSIEISLDKVDRSQNKYAEFAYLSYTYKTTGEL